MDTKRHFEYSTASECDVVATSSKFSFLVRILKTTIFLVCLVGFLYQTVEFIQHFLKHPTFVTIEMKSPEKIILPAITFCNINPVQRSAYCSKYPDNCEKPNDMEAFCKNRPHYCTRSNMSDFLIPKRRYLTPNEYNDTLTNQDIKELSQNSSRLLTRFINDKEPIIPVFFDEWPGFETHQCFTENYLLENMSDPHVLALSDKNSDTTMAFYEFNLEEEETFNPDAEPGLLFSIHSPYETINPYFKGKLLKPGKNFKIHLRMEEQNFLPYPFESDCIDYEELWKENKTRPRSEKECSNRCSENFSLTCYGCIFNSYPMTLNNINTLCNISDVGEQIENVRDEVLEKTLLDCIKACKKDCRRLLYPHTIEEHVGKPYVQKNDKKNIAIWINIPNPEVIVLSHRPQFMDVELFSYIGGFMGYWLGISVWALSDILGHTLTVALNFFKTIKSENRI